MNPRALSGRASIAMPTPGESAGSCEQHAERKRIYETLHPEAKHGAKGGWHNNKTENLETDKLSVSSYAADASAATGVSERTVRRDTQFRSALLYDRSSVAVGFITTEAGFACGDFSSFAFWNFG